jgi:hypothetical protein
VDTASFVRLIVIALLSTSEVVVLPRALWLRADECRRGLHTRVVLKFLLKLLKFDINVDSFVN